MKCEDCYKFDICSKAIIRVDNVDTHREINCKYFIDKSKIIELPCKVGDTYWVIKDEYTICPKGLIRSMCDTSTCVCSEEYCESKVVTKLQEGKFDTVTNIVRCMYSGQFGTRVFLTKADAENKLKGGSGENAG